MARVRLGVALLVPSPVSQEIDGLRRALGDPALERIPAHLTLVPPVNVAERDLADAVEVLSQAGSSTRPFRVTMGPPATFMPDNPVIYLPVSGESAAALERLRALVLLAPLARTLT
ncbi:MAG: 2'-5' RNA ligase family protein, partial [Acidimicrobiales bacterium]